MHGGKVMCDEHNYDLERMEKALESEDALSLEGSYSPEEVFKILSELPVDEEKDKLFAEGFEQRQIERHLERAKEFSEIVGLLDGRKMISLSGSSEDRKDQLRKAFESVREAGETGNKIFKYYKDYGVLPKSKEDLEGVSNEADW